MQARAIYEAEGSKAAANELGIPLRTVCRWAAEGDWEPPRNPLMEAPRLAARERWAALRIEKADKLGAELDALIVNLSEAAAAGDDRAIKNVAQGISELVRSANLLAGEATSRTESTTVALSVDQIKARIGELDAKAKALEPPAQPVISANNRTDIQQPQPAADGSGHTQPDGQL